MHHFGKDVVLVAIPLVLSTGLNAYVEIHNQTAEFTLTLPIFWNSVIFAVSSTCVLIGGVAWYRGHSDFSAVVEKIKNKPRYAIPLGTFPTKSDEEPQGDPQPMAKRRKKAVKASNITTPENGSGQQAKATPGDPEGGAHDEEVPNEG